MPKKMQGNTRCKQYKGNSPCTAQVQGYRKLLLGVQYNIGTTRTKIEIVGVQYSMENNKPEKMGEILAIRLGF